MKNTPKAIVTLVLRAAFGGTAYFSFYKPATGPSSSGGLLSVPQTKHLFDFLDADRRIGGLPTIDFRGQFGIQSFGKVNGAAEFLHRLPQLGTNRLNFHHVALHITARYVDLLRTFLQLATCAFVFAKVGLQFVALEHETQQFLLLKQIARFARIQIIQIATHIRDRLVGPRVF